MMNKKLQVGIAAAIVTVVVGLVFASPRQMATANADDEAAVRDALMKSALSFEKNDIAMATQVWVNDESLTVFESGHANYGWADYRDHHLVPEMGEMKNTKYGFSDIRVHLQRSSTQSQQTFQITERRVTSTAVDWAPQCSNCATDNGESCIGTPARHAGQRLLHRQNHNRLIKILESP